MQNAEVKMQNEERVFILTSDLLKSEIDNHQLLTLFSAATFAYQRPESFMVRCPVLKST